MLKGTAAINIFLGLVALFLMWKIFSALQMELLSEILGAFISVGLVALIIIFQPEIRQFLLALGTPSFFNSYGKKFRFLKPLLETSVNFGVEPVIVACKKMGEAKEGALIIITKQNELKQIVDTGDIIDASISTSLIENIFFKNSPMHDGAMIITNNRIVAAKCILPVSKQQLRASAGLRHRAAVGITEVSDSVAIVVSEETGHLSYSSKGNMKYNISLNDLHEALIEDLNITKEENK